MFFRGCHKFVCKYEDLESRIGLSKFIIFNILFNDILLNFDFLIFPEVWQKKDPKFCFKLPEAFRIILEMPEISKN